MVGFCCVFLALANASPVSAQCLALSGQQMLRASPWPGEPEVGHIYKVQRWYVQDGDSLSVAHGQRLRLGQINTTEMAHKSRPAQPYAQQARDQLDQQLAQQTEIYLRLLPNLQDHYGRWLVKIYDGAGLSAEALLVARGLAYVVSMDAQGADDCLWQHESSARKQGLGIWRTALSAVYQAADLSPKRGGFMRMGGVVADISESQHDWYIGFGGQAGIKIDKQLLAGSHLRANNRQQLEQWAGQTIIARGWLSWRKLSKKQRQKGYLSGLMSVYHLDMLEQAPALSGL
jgi:endonuclease YncB( thermonuclease family)